MLVYVFVIRAKMIRSSYVWPNDRISIVQELRDQRMCVGVKIRENLLKGERYTVTRYIKNPSIPLHQIVHLKLVTDA